MRLTISVIVLTLLPASWSLALTTNTVSFQNGVNGYIGTYDHYIAQTPDGGVDGSVQPDLSLIGTSQQGLIRFDSIFGSGPGQIPLGSRIVDASLQLSTIGGLSTSTDGSNGPYTVAGLTSTFGSTTTYASYAGGHGAWFEDGHTTRPQGNYGRLDVGETQRTDIRSIVQAWSDGTANNGLAVTGGIPSGTDDWHILTTGNASPGSRPKLSVTYTTPANLQVSTFQRGDANGYTNVDSARVSSKCNYTGLSCTAGPGAEATVDGNTLTNITLQLADAGSAENLALFRFNDVFGSNPTQAPAGKPVQRAWLVLTTLASASTSARISDPVDAYELTQSWTTAKKFSQFGTTLGLQAGDGDITQETLYRTPAVANDSEIWFDVTGYAERIRNGSANNGIAIQARSADGWQFSMNNAGTIALRPRLVVMSDLSTTGGTLAGDYNGDNTVDAADYVLSRKNNLSYSDFRSNYGNTGSGPATPQPMTVVKYDASPKNDGYSSGTLALATLPAAPTPAGVIGVNMVRGAGVTAAGLTSGFSSRGWTNIDVASAVAAGDYYEWGLTLDATHTASLSKLDFTARRGDAASPTNFELQASFDNFATAPIVLSDFTYMGRASGDAPTTDPSLDTPFYYMTHDQPGRPDTTFSSTDPIPTVDLSSVAALQNIAAGSTLKFRLYGWGGTDENSSFGFRVTGPSVTGIVSAVSGLGSGATVPEPSTLLLAGIFAMTLAAGRRRQS